MAFVGISVPGDVARLLSLIEVPGEREPRDHYHITLLFIGDSVPIAEVAKAAITAFSVTSQTRPFAVLMNRVISFPGGNSGVPIIAEVRSASLHALRGRLAEAFDHHGIEYSKRFKEFRPHVTLSYADQPMDDMSIAPVTFTVSEVVIWGGDNGEDKVVVRLPLEVMAPSDLGLRVAARTKM